MKNEKLINFIDSFQSVVINSLDENKNPFSSYAPFVKYENSYYVYLSNMAKHSKNLKNNKKSSIFFCEDENSCENIFARKRVIMQCNTTIIEKDSKKYNSILDSFEKKFDKKMVQTLRAMSDFNVYEFKAFYGEAIFGFGKAYNLGGENFDELIQREGTKGHGRK